MNDYYSSKTASPRHGRRQRARPRHRPRLASSARPSCLRHQRIELRRAARSSG
ncbi:MAG: hypothetical protein ACLVL7_00290 [Anaerotruncus massiliensis (ex Togo et al. 2019)]